MPAWGSAAWPESALATTNSTGKKALPPKISLTASSYAPAFIEARPVDTSGSEVAAASTVAPNSRPLKPQWVAKASPLRSSTTPATSVTTAEARNTSPVRPVLAGGCGWAGAGGLGGGLPVGAASCACQGKPFCAFPISHRPTTQSPRMSRPAGVARATITAAGSWLPTSTAASTASTSTPSSASASEAAR